MRERLAPMAVAICLTSFVLCEAAAAGTLQAGGHYATARDEWLAQGGSEEEANPAVEFAGAPIVWDNGGANSVNGLASERNTFTNGTGGPEGDHVSTVADDFDIISTSLIDEIRVCLYHNGTTAEMYIYNDDGGSPALPVTAPLWGAPTTADIVSTTFVDNTARCPNAFGFPGRQYVFSAATTGIQITLEPGRYWLAVVGQGGTRAFWANSSPPAVLNTARWGSTIFVIPYWTDTTPTSGQSSFAFEITSTSGARSVPVAGIGGLIAAALLLFALGVFAAGRRRRA